MNLIDYIQGRRKGKEAHRIEREAMQDAFLAEALEGFESAAGNHASAIRRMQQQIAERSQPEGRHITFWLSMAASVALVIGFGWYFLNFKFQVSSLKLYDTRLSEIMLADSMKSSEIIAMTAPTVQPDVQDATVQEKPMQRKALSSPQPAQRVEIYLDIVSDDVKVDAEMMNEDRAEVAIEPTTHKLEESSRDQQKMMLGKVVDKSGEPLPGVNITVKNSAKGVVTNADGEFVLNIDDKTILQANFVGYETQEVVADTSKLLIAMHESAAQLEEVVVVGYGTQRKSNTAGSVTTVPEQLRKIVPEPVIGQKAYEKYLRENVIKPVDGECARVKGKVQVRFSVDTNGKPCNMAVTHKLCDAADREAMRLILEGCDWTQGNTEVTVSVRF